jgi:acetyl-CoA carboxylase carboxyl transferase subunit beta
MDWFKRKQSNISASPPRELPDGLWVKCEKCKEVLYKKQLEENVFTCPKCSNHFRISSREYVTILFDEGSFVETEKYLRSKDPLEFVDTKRYRDRLDAAIREKALFEAMRTGHGTIDGRAAALACMDFGFIGGSMGSVVGEKFSRAAALALERHLPFISISASGGARMMEGAISLMQMAKTSARLADLAEAGLPYISILTDPTTGGVTASFAMLGDINIAEPGALIGFAGPRVIEQATKKKLPEGFQRAEFVLEHGFADMIVHRRELKKTVSTMLGHFMD